MSDFVQNVKVRVKTQDTIALTFNVNAERKMDLVPKNVLPRLSLTFNRFHYSYDFRRISKLYIFLYI